MILKLRDTHISGLEKQLKGGGHSGEDNEDSFHGSLATMVSELEL